MVVQINDLVTFWLIFLCTHSRNICIFNLYITFITYVMYVH